MMTTEKTTIASSYIKLDQYLKWTGIAGSGSEAKLLIETGQVAVNQEVEIRRGRKLYPGDKIAVFDRVFIIDPQNTDGSQE